MKIFFPFLIGVLLACARSSAQIALTAKAQDQDQRFEQNFKAIPPEELDYNVFRAFGKDWTCITAGSGEKYNSMTASYGGWGILFGKPTAWCFLRANRYTLELILKEKRFTMSFFDEQYRDQLLLFGSKSGRNSDKMKETRLNFIVTPGGGISYQEARLIIECKLIEVTTVKPEDFFTPEARRFIEDGFQDAKDYHKLVFGEIVGVWVRK